MTHAAPSIFNLATAKGPKGAARKFATKADALAAYKRGEITLETPVTIG